MLWPLELRANSSDQAKTNRRKVKAAQRAVSLSPDDAVGRDVVGELSRYVNTAAREHRYDVVLPNDVHRLLELFAMRAGRSRPDALAFCLHEGVRLLLLVPGIATIRDCRKAAVAAGSEDLDWLERWGFDVAARSGRCRRWYRNIDPAAVTLCGEVARELGLRPATLATLATMAMLLQVRDVPDDRKKEFLEEVTRFGRAVRKRARRAEQSRDRAHAIPVPSLIVSFDDVLRNIK